VVENNEKARISFFSHDFFQHKISKENSLGPVPFPIACLAVAKHAIFLISGLARVEMVSLSLFSLPVPLKVVSPQIFKGTLSNILSLSHSFPHRIFIRRHPSRMHNQPFFLNNL
jgi:hypothetical protein